MNKDHLLTISESFKMLGDETRLRILNELFHGELCVHQIAEQLEMTISSISHQLKLLKMARIVSSRKEGRHVYYSFLDHHIHQILEIMNQHVAEK